MRTHFYINVKGLGNVAVSRHALVRMDEQNIPQALFEKVLLTSTDDDKPDGQHVLWREADGIRIVIIVDPTPNKGAKLVKTVYRVTPQALARKAGLHE